MLQYNLHHLHKSARLQWYMYLPEKDTFSTGHVSRENIMNAFDAPCHQRTPCIMWTELFARRGE